MTHHDQEGTPVTTPHDIQPAAKNPMTEADPGIEVTVKDLRSGDTESTVIRDDYVIVTAGSCEVTSISAYGNGTAVLTVKGSKR